MSASNKYPTRVSYLRKISYLETLGPYGQKVSGLFFDLGPQYGEFCSCVIGPWGIAMVIHEHVVSTSPIGKSKSLKAVLLVTSKTEQCIFSPIDLFWIFL